MSTEELGVRLRKAREERGISLEQVQADTKIRLRYLAALEAGDHRAIPGDVYARGFVRTYGKYLGLDPWELVEQLREGEKPPEEDAAPRHRLARKISPLPAALLVGGLVVMAGAIYYLGVLPRRPQEPPPPPPPQVQEPVTPPAPVEPPPIVDPVPPRPEVRILREDIGDEVRFRVAADTLQVTIELADYCWLQVYADDRWVQQGTLPPGTVQVFTATRTLSLRVGRPGMALVRVGERELGLLFQDPATDPRTVIFELEAP
ncbi:MAG TPA: RodZ domain-containing protein [Bacillota bacterium]|nr:RodZ domain-containing protein [Bacillota bacterium]